jgi:hypothetical protein
VKQGDEGKEETADSASKRPDQESPPPNIDRKIVEAMDFDRSMFDADPRLQEFVRKAFPREFWPLEDEDLFRYMPERLVRVTRGPVPFTRIREPLGAGPPGHLPPGVASLPTIRP